MRQLTGLDTSFLRLESRSTYGHVSGLTIYDPSTTPTGDLTREDLRNLIEARLHLLPPFRWRLAEVPLKLDDPYWIESPGVRPRLPHPRDRARAARRPTCSSPSRPRGSPRARSTARARCGSSTSSRGSRAALRRGADEDAPRGDRRRLGRGDHGHPARHDARAARGRAARAASGSRRARRTISWMLGRGAVGALTRPLKTVRMAPRTLPSLADVPGMANVPGVDTLSRASARVVRTGVGRRRRAARAPDI